MKKIKKRGAVYGVIALLLCTAVYLNWSYVGAPDDLLAAEQAGVGNQAATTPSSGAVQDNYFAASRLTR